MKRPEEEKGFILHYDDIAQHLFESLVELGYVPIEDEILDLADIVMEMMLQQHLNMGGSVEMIQDEDGEEE